MLSNFHYEPIVKAALNEDLGFSGDITTNFVVPSNINATAQIVAKHTGVLSGIDIAMSAFQTLNPNITIEINYLDGMELNPNDIVATIIGPANTILSAERTALNFLGRLSGIATVTNKFVKAVKDFPATILCTRKTTPTLRIIEKYAVLCGGGVNHRFGLFDAILIKDNHIHIAGGLTEAIKRIRKISPNIKIEVEVETLKQLEEAIELHCDTVLLDNMSVDTIREGVKLAKGRVKLEASGSITLNNCREIASTYVDYISVGAITHSVKNFDFTLEVK